MVNRTDHPISNFFNNDEEFIKFKNECSKTGTTEESIANAEKIGFKTNIKAINPLDVTKEVPVYFANFVLMDYGFGAVFGCPAHDQRDLDFALKYKLEVLPVVCPSTKIERRIRKIIMQLHPRFNHILKIKITFSYCSACSPYF